MNNTMKAAVVYGTNDMRVSDVPIPKLDSTSMLIKVRACSVCGSDVRILDSGNSRVTYPAIIGHEMAGEVVEIGASVKGYKVGDRVSLGADVPCGKCDWCLNGMGNCCDINYAMGYQFAGGFAEYCLINPTVLNYGPITRIPADMSLEESSLAEPLACCINGMERALFAKGKSILILGAGPIGIFLTQLGKTLGASFVMMADPDSSRLSRASKFCPDYLVDLTKEDLEEEVRTVTKGRGFDIIFTACPSIEAQEQSIRLIAKHGVINFFGGLPSQTRNISFKSNDLHYREFYVTGSHGSTPKQHKQAIELIASGKINVKQMITHRFSLPKVNEAFAAVRNKSGLKVVVIP